jgi:bis(5'-nucleosyl)-tetraphosphatase (symmetrical)
MKTIVIGDAHGCIDELVALLDAVKYRKGEDHLFFTGDLADKGPDSKTVIDYVQRLEAVSVRGNHEDKHIRYRRHLKKKRIDPKYKIPMQAPDWFLETHDQLTDEDISWMQDMPLTLNIGEYGLWHIVHAGARYGEELFVRYVDRDTGKMIPFDGTYGVPPNGVFWSEHESWKAEHYVVYGHQPWPDVRVENKTYGIDTGCVHGGKLSALVWDGEPKAMTLPEIVQVSAQRTYYERKVA